MLLAIARYVKNMKNTKKSDKIKPNHPMNVLLLKKNYNIYQRKK